MGWYLICCCQIFCFLSLLWHSQIFAELCSHDQSSALLQFKQLFSFKKLSASSPCDRMVPSYPKMISWKEDTDCCSWNGVTCNMVTGHVIELDLSCSWLYGSIPSNSSLFSLPKLQRLNLAFNNFNSSQISSSFNQFPSLILLNLSSSNFNGHVPCEISCLSKLVSLDLSHNHVRLETIVLQGLAQNLTELKELILDDIDMSTVIPSSLANLSSSLTSLSLSGCLLQGYLPNNIFHLPHLHTLSLANNYGLTYAFLQLNWSSPLRFLDVSSTSFSKELPDSISNLNSLRHLNLQGCKFTGLIPASLGNLTQLTLLSLSYNYFTGQIPSSFSNLEQISVLDLSNNNFTSEMPEIFVNLTQLSYLDLSMNQLVGRIPYHITSLRNLVSIDFHENLLIGTIPSRLLILPSLEFMDLSYNQLTGPIHEFQNNSLRRINLSNNRFYGSIPSSIFEFESLTDLELSENNLSGILELHRFAKLKHLQTLALSHNNLSLSSTFKANFSFPQVHYLKLSSCNLSEFPVIFRSLDRIEVLDLSSNKIHGPIPNWIWNVGIETLKVLNLSHNSLTVIEKIPWKNLEYLDLRSNLLEGSLPIPPSGMTIFLISNNNLTGEIPHSICNMTIIQILDLSNNNLSGRIPECMGNSSNSLSVLDLQKNRFYGAIPGTFAKDNILRTLNLNHNILEGPIPRSLVNCTMLEVIDLGNNNIHDTFPYWFGDLRELQVLILQSNKFYGSIPEFREEFSLSKLRIFDVSNNNFRGSLPRRYFDNLFAIMNADKTEKKLKYMGDTYYQDTVALTLKGSKVQMQKILIYFTTIDFSNNNFQGEIPEIIGNLDSLHLLNLSKNSLTGHIPPALGNLRQLEALDLSSNKLVGEIPWELTNLNYLQVLNLSQNRLVGPIPRDNHFETFANSSYSGNLGLCGFPLSKKCVSDETPMGKDEAESVFEFGWEVVLIGYGCGMVLGLILGFLVFTTRKPQWLVKIVEGEPHRKEGRLNH